MLSRTDEDWPWRLVVLVLLGALVIALIAYVTTGLIEGREVKVLRSGDVIVLVDKSHDAEGGEGGGGVITLLPGGCVGVEQHSKARLSWRSGPPEQPRSASRIRR